MKVSFTSRWKSGDGEEGHEGGGWPRRGGHGEDRFGVRRERGLSAPSDSAVACLLHLQRCSRKAGLSELLVEMALESELPVLSTNFLC